MSNKGYRPLKAEYIDLLERLKRNVPCYLEAKETYARHMPKSSSDSIESSNEDILEVIFCFCNF
jgi:hypothetical protein